MTTATRTPATTRTTGAWATRTRTAGTLTPRTRATGARTARTRAATRSGDVFVVIGAKGVERIVEIDLSGGERDAFEKSAAAVQTLVDACRKIAPDLEKKG